MITDPGFATTDTYWSKEPVFAKRRRIWYVYKSTRQEAPPTPGPRNGHQHLKYRGDHRVQRRYVDVWVLVGAVKSVKQRGAENLASVCWPNTRIIVKAHKLPETACVRHQEPK